MQHIVEEEHLEETDAAIESDDDVTIDFVPDPHALARSPGSARHAPRWLIAAAVVVAIVLVFAALAMKPGPGAVRAASATRVQLAPANPSATSGKVDLFQLPPWNDDEPGAK